jgi:uncharacterized protein (TIGR03435 family)
MSLHTRIYSLLLVLHPAVFRDRYAEEMALDFEDALATHGPATLYSDALLSLARQWRAPTPAAAPIPSLLAGRYTELYQTGLGPFAQSSPAAHHPEPRKIFEVASIRENKSSDRPTMNMLIGPGTYGYKPTGGYFHVTNLPVIAYIQFAYNLYGYKGGHLDKQVPAWVRDAHYDIEARTEYPNPTKDDYRAMMRALLAERFHLAIHPETHDSPLLNLILAKPGPSITPHAPDDPTCQQHKPTTFFSPCGTISVNPGDPDKMAGSKVTMDDLAEFFPGFLGARPVLDKTGLTGTFDFTLDYISDQRALSQPDQPFPTFLQGLTDQLGFKVVPARGPVELYTFDHIDPLQQN